ncbi:MAG: UbiH/UbiF/VisC/COQ6 family ubiquinone biosynthesis hydroxylase [Gammaproteobacteria bacterium]|jgi:2-octaprenylphenol hydroxylase|nr:UbiH/UbiF/VisC/COQ6 family ubiquinone biosynthesis hydroxylase [Gammaproteobacteria bacterium]
MMQNDTTYDVVITGAGIVGLSCALALAQRGIRLALIEAQSHPMQDLPLPTDPFDSKVVAITRASEHFLDRLGAWTIIQSSRLCPYQHMKVWDNVMDGRIEFSAMDFFEKNLGYIIEQRVILSALWQNVLQQKNIQIFTGTKIENVNFLMDEVEVSLTSNTLIKAQLVIGADGANSKLRELCQISTAGWDYHQSAIVATVEGTQSHYHTAYQRFAPSGPLALLPLAHPFQSSIVWTSSKEEASTLMAASSSDFAFILQREINGVMGEMRLIGERFIFPLRTHHANQYVMARSVLIGDAAHTLHPLAGQGVNLGLLDVASLVEVVAAAKTSHRDLGSLSVLKKYERQRKWHNQMMIWTMELFKQGFGSSSTILQRARNIGLNWVNKQSFLKQIFAKLALGTMGPIPSLAKGISERNSHAKNHIII